MYSALFKLALIVIVLVFLLRRLVKLRLFLAGSRGKPPVDLKSDSSPWEILGLQPGASKDMIVKAYRKKMMKNHPDKVADLDPELQNFANLRAVQIKEAYETLIKLAG